MPRRDDIDRILVLGSGPIVIGQAAEFDYSGAQACKVLLEEGYEVVLVNSNPATIMTDPEFATATYIEPLTPASVARVIERERPDALLPTLGGQGGGIARTESEFRQRVGEALAASPIGQVLVEESVIGWGEFELEVMRDYRDNVVIVCSIENIDPMGVHTGDSVTVAPQQTLSDRIYQRLRDQAIAAIRAVGDETGGSNVQFAVEPRSEEILVIDINPRVSRSSA